MKHRFLYSMDSTLLDETRSDAAASRTIFECLEDPQASAALPSIKSILSELQKLTTSPNSHIEDITRLVRLDQTISLQVLRIANSAYYAPPEPVADVEAALLYIGLSTLRNAVMATRCMESTCHIPQQVFDWKEFWIHAAGVGHITMDLASRLRAPTVPAESYYLMGQFHDIGKVVLAVLMPEEFGDIYLRAAQSGSPLAALEVQTLGVEHGHIGAWYMEKQDIPLPVREAVRFHHSGMMEEKTHFLHAALVRLADHLAHSAGLGQSGNYAPLGDPFRSAEWEWYITHCDLTRPEERSLRSTVTRQVEKTALLVRDYIV
jgi:HD-like signal output (HDOD) protein